MKNYEELVATIRGEKKRVEATIEKMSEEFDKRFNELHEQLEMLSEVLEALEAANPGESSKPPQKEEDDPS